MIIKITHKDIEDTQKEEKIKKDNRAFKKNLYYT